MRWMESGETMAVVEPTRKAVVELVVSTRAWMKLEACRTAKVRRSSRVGRRVTLGSCVHGLKYERLSPGCPQVIVM